MSKSKETRKAASSLLAISGLRGEAEEAPVPGTEGRGKRTKRAPVGREDWLDPSEAIKLNQRGGKPKKQKVAQPESGGELLPTFDENEASVPGTESCPGDGEQRCRGSRRRRRKGRRCVLSAVSC